jgi:hypothetical protein
MIWDGNGNGRVLGSPLHNDVAAALTHLEEAFARENAANLASR